MTTKKTLYSVLALFSLAISWTQGAETRVRTEILTLSIGKGLPECYFVNRGKASKLSVIPQRLGVPVKYEGSSHLSLFATEEEAKAASRRGSKIEPVATFELPAKSDQVLVVLDFSKKKKTDVEETEAENQEETEEEDGPVAKAFGLSRRDFKAGDYRVFNFSDKEVNLSLGEIATTIAGGEEAKISDASLRKETLDLSVKLQTAFGEEMRDVYSSVWGHRPIQRNFVFILGQESKFRPLVLKKYTDVPSSN